MASTICRDRLREFQDDHRRHIVDLKGLIEQYDGQPKDHGDLKGVLIKGMTAIQAMAGDEMALKAMQTNERLTNRTYQETLGDRALPDDVREIVQRNRNDEARHLDWVNRALSQRLWESAGTGTSAHP